MKKSVSYYAIVVCLSLVSAVLATTVTYDYAADYSNDNGNPNGAWSYGAKYKDINGKPTGAFKCFDMTEDSWYIHWNMGDTEGNTFGGDTWLNLSGSTQYNIDDKHVSLNGDAYCTSTARWTAPADGAMDLTISLGGSGSTRMIMFNDSVLDDGMIYSYAADDMAVKAGDTIDVTAYGAYAYGNTQTDITIFFTPIPEPATLTLFTLGGLAVLKRGRKG